MRGRNRDVVVLRRAREKIGRRDELPRQRRRRPTVDAAGRDLVARKRLAGRGIDQLDRATREIPLPHGQGGHRRVLVEHVVRLVARVVHLERRPAFFIGVDARNLQRTPERPTKGVLGELSAALTGTSGADLVRQPCLTAPSRRTCTLSIPDTDAAPRAPRPAENESAATTTRMPPGRPPGFRRESARTVSSQVRRGPAAPPRPGGPKPCAPTGRSPDPAVRD